jgi:Flp pilus assembly protein TadG
MMKKMLNIEGQRGAAAIEFAIVLSVLIVLLFGIIEFSILLYDKAVITNASREGARAGIVFSNGSCLDQAQIAAVVNTYCANNLITFDGATTGPITQTNPADGSGVTGNPLTVTVTYNYGFLVLPNFVSGLTGGINLTAQTVMRYE